MAQCTYFQRVFGYIEDIGSTGCTAHVAQARVRSRGESARRLRRADGPETRRCMCHSQASFAGAIRTPPGYAFHGLGSIPGLLVLGTLRGAVLHSQSELWSSAVHPELVQFVGVPSALALAFKTEHFSHSNKGNTHASMQFQVFHCPLSSPSLSR